MELLAWSKVERWIETRTGLDQHYFWRLFAIISTFRRDLAVAGHRPAPDNTAGVICVQVNDALISPVIVICARTQLSGRRSETLPTTPIPRMF